MVSAGYVVIARTGDIKFGVGFSQRIGSPPRSPLIRSLVIGPFTQCLELQIVQPAFKRLYARSPATSKFSGTAS